VAQAADTSQVEAFVERRLVGFDSPMLYRSQFSLATISPVAMATLTSTMKAAGSIPAVGGAERTAA
jgi:hypothetical protein